MLRKSIPASQPLQQLQCRHIQCSTEEVIGVAGSSAALLVLPCQRFLIVLEEPSPAACEM